MKKIISIFMILVLMMTVVLAVEENSATKYDGITVYDTEVAEPYNIFDFFGGLFAFTSVPDYYDVSVSYRADYTDGVNSAGNQINSYGGRCQVGDFIQLVACDYPNSGQNCYNIFQEVWQKTTSEDSLSVRTACAGGDCYKYSWYQDIINDRYVGYDCLTKTSTEPIVYNCWFCNNGVLEEKYVSQYTSYCTEVPPVCIPPTTTTQKQTTTTQKQTTTTTTQSITTVSDTTTTTELCIGCGDFCVEDSMCGENQVCNLDSYTCEEKIGWWTKLFNWFKSLFIIEG